MKLTTRELHILDGACEPIFKAFLTPPYLVGSAAEDSAQTYRDVDVRLILSADEFRAVCPTRYRWELLCLALTTHLKAATGLPIDFQIQEQSIANAKHGGKYRNPLGIGRVFAGGGDATPEWPEGTR